MPGRLYVHSWGEGEHVVLVHGSGSSGAVFKSLFQSAGYHFIAPDRRGYGMSTSTSRLDFEVDARDVADLLGEGAHLVGHSYGGIVALLAAALRPGAVKSLAVNEPPAFGAAAGHPAVDALTARLAPVFAARDELSPDEFIARFNTAIGWPVPPGPLDEEAQRGVRSLMSERPVMEAKIPFKQLAAASFPKLILSGTWHEAFEAVCDVLVRELHARRAVFPGTGHSLVGKGAPLLARLLEFWESGT
jgi:pimeloyl-ACP methyl ester carboxylesterase